MVLEVIGEIPSLHFDVISVLLMQPANSSRCCTCAKIASLEQGNGAGPDHLVLNHLPFAEDLRVAKFTSFEAKADLIPTEQQVQCMSDLVQSLDLQSGSISAPASCAGPLLARDVFRRWRPSVTAYKDTCSLWISAHLWCDAV